MHAHTCTDSLWTQGWWTFCHLVAPWPAGLPAHKLAPPLVPDLAPAPEPGLELEDFLAHTWQLEVVQAPELAPKPGPPLGLELVPAENGSSSITWSKVSCRVRMSSDISSWERPWTPVSSGASLGTSPGVWIRPHPDPRAVELHSGLLWHGSGNTASTPGSSQVELPLGPEPAPEPAGGRAPETECSRAGPGLQPTPSGSPRARVTSGASPPRPPDSGSLPARDPAPTHSQRQFS